MVAPLAQIFEARDRPGRHEIEVVPFGSASGIPAAGPRPKRVGNMATIRCEVGLPSRCGGRARRRTTNRADALFLQCENDRLRLICC